MHARSCEMRRVGVRVRVPHCTMDARSHPRRARGRGRSGRRSRRRWRRRALRRTSWWGRCWANAARAGDGVPDEAAEGAGRVVVRRWLYMSALEEDAAMAAVAKGSGRVGQSRRGRPLPWLGRTKQGVRPAVFKYWDSVCTRHHCCLSS